MHELSIALSIADMAAEEAERHGGARVAAVHLRLGPLSGVVKEALLSAYELAREGSAVEHSQLVIEEVPIRIFCATCDAERDASLQEMCCPTCGSPPSRVVSGREMEVVALEIES
jgi:hydrogenase nickel incorporation protein HypA/HybF